MDKNETGRSTLEILSILAIAILLTLGAFAGYSKAVMRYKANQVIEQANAQAQQIVDNAVNEANGIRQSSIKYTDDMLASLQTIVRHTLDDAQGRFDSFRSSMQSSYEIVSANRQELSGSIVVQQEEPAEEEPEVPEE